MADEDQKSGSWKTGLSKIEPSLESEAEPVFSLDEHAGGSNAQIQLETAQASEPSLESPAGSNQVELLKKYISLKESEVRDLKEQRRQFQTLVQQSNDQVTNLARENKHLAGELDTLRRQIELQTAEAAKTDKRHAADLQLLKNDYEERLNRVANQEGQIQELLRNKEAWKEKVREDLKRIKLKERELENKYELLKRDTAALLESKDRHVLELKKKNDALELEMESLEERLRQRSNAMAAVDAKKRRLIETLRLATALLEEIDQLPTGDSLDDERKAG